MGHSHKSKVVDCDGDAIDGAKKALKGKFAEMRELSKEARDGKSAEAVHDMRVAARRFRSALQDFRPCLNKRSVDLTLKQIRNISDALGEVRDQDVAILALENLAAKIPVQCSATLQKLIDSRKEIRKAARKKLEHDLVDDLKKLRSTFHETLELADKLPATLRQRQSNSYRHIATAVIISRLAELEKLGDNLKRPNDVDGLHQMRIAAKRLRYAIELLHECWLPGPRHLAGDVAQLQTTLGRVHDCDIWIENFVELQVVSGKSKQSEEGRTFRWFRLHFLKLRNKHLQEARAEWKAWQAKDASRKLREFLKVPAVKS
ncbi:MAG TPA: CHAD domain-containing protein [Pyrinomonadaceae bacterium]|nr:CHAD domain-containing protein [Pyrinomonadaceae bacterium]